MYKVINLDEKLFLQGKESKEGKEGKEAKEGKEDKQGKEDRGVQGKRRCRGHQQECNRGCQDLAGCPPQAGVQGSLGAAPGRGYKKPPRQPKAYQCPRYSPPQLAGMHLLCRCVLVFLCWHKS